MEDSILYEASEFLNESGYTPLITDNKQELLSLIKQTGYNFEYSEWESLSKGNILSRFLNDDKIKRRYKIYFIGRILPKIRSRSLLKIDEPWGPDYSWVEKFYNELYKWYEDNKVLNNIEILEEEYSFINKKEFGSLPINDKLQKIAAILENNIFDKNSKPVKVNYININNVLNDEWIKNLKNHLHVFRHFKPTTIKEQEEYTLEEKEALLNLSIGLIKYLESNDKNDK